MPDVTPRDVVEALPIEELAAMVSGDGIFSYMDDPCFPRFRCPRCSHVDHNGPTAEVQSDWLWSCSRCRASGTVFELQRIVLEDGDLLVRAWQRLEPVDA